MQHQLQSLAERWLHVDNKLLHHPSPNSNYGIAIGDHTDSKVHGANMGPIWGQQDPGGPHGGPMNFAIWATLSVTSLTNIDLKLGHG